MRDVAGHASSQSLTCVCLLLLEMHEPHPGLPARMAKLANQVRPSFGAGPALIHDGPWDAETEAAAHVRDVYRIYTEEVVRTGRVASPHTEAGLEAEGLSRQSLGSPGPGKFGVDLIK